MSVPPAVTVGSGVAGPAVVAAHGCGTAGEVSRRTIYQAELIEARGNYTVFPEFQL